MQENLLQAARTTCLFLILYFSNSFSVSCQTILGSVKDENNNPIIDCNVFFENSQITYSNSLGYFTLKSNNKRIINLSHIQFETLQDTLKIENYNKNDTIYLNYTMKSTTNLLDEVVILSYKKSFYKNLFMNSLVQLAEKLSDEFSYEYLVSHSIENNAGFTNKFKGEVIVSPSKVKAVRDIDKGKIHFFNKKINTSIKHTIIKNKIDAFLNEDCGKYCKIINNSNGLHSFAPIPFIDYIVSLKYFIHLINNDDYIFELSTIENKNQYVINFNPKKWSIKKAESGTIYIDKVTLDIQKIELKYTQLPKNKIIGVLRKNVLPVFLRVKDDIKEFSFIINNNRENHSVFKKITLKHYLIFKNNYKKKQRLNIIHKTNWELKKTYKIDPKNTNMKEVNKYMDFYE